MFFCSFFLVISKYIICSFSKPPLHNGHLLSSPFFPLIHSKYHFWKWISLYTAIFLLCSTLLMYFRSAYNSHLTFWPILLNLSPRCSPFPSLVYVQSIVLALCHCAFTKISLHAHSPSTITFTCLIINSRKELLFFKKRCFLSITILILGTKCWSVAVAA